MGWLVQGRWESTRIYGQKSVNSWPLENKILIKSERVADRPDETVAIYADGHNFGFGKNNFLAYVGECKNTIN